MNIYQTLKQKMIQVLTDAANSKEAKGNTDTWSLRIRINKIKSLEAWDKEVYDLVKKSRNAPKDYIEFVLKDMEIHVGCEKPRTNVIEETVYNIFLNGITNFILKDALNDDPLTIDEENMVCFIKLLGLNEAILCMADSSRLYDTVNQYGNENISRFNTVCNILIEKIGQSQEKDLDSIIEMYKFIYQYAKKDERMETFENVRNELANKLMEKYDGVWGLEFKNIIQAFLDSDELEKLEDLENLEINECKINKHTASGTSKTESETVYMISDRDKAFFKLVRFNNSQNISYQFPKCLVPIMNFAMERNLPIPILDNGELKMVYNDSDVNNPFNSKEPQDIEL